VHELKVVDREVQRGGGGVEVRKVQKKEVINWKVQEEVVVES
jgi:hypothetical protein